MLILEEGQDCRHKILNPKLLQYKRLTKFVWSELALIRFERINFQNYPKMSNILWTKCLDTIVIFIKCQNDSKLYKYLYGNKQIKREDVWTIGRTPPNKAKCIDSSHGNIDMAVYVFL